MSKILFISPPMSLGEIYSNYGAVAATLPPLGICYIAAVLEQAGHGVRIIDGIAEKTTKEELKEKILEYKPNIVGITALTVSYNRAIETAKFIKNIDKNIILVLGGPHVSSIPVKTFQENDNFDIGVVGEGEMTFKELIKHLENKRKADYKPGLEKINGLVFKNNNGEIVLTPRRALIEDLDTLPLPARHLLPDITLYSNLLTHDQPPNFASIVPSRGCPFQCIYCDQNVFGHRWRVFSADYVIKEIEELVTKFGVRTVQIQDDLFTLDKARVTRFCDLLIKKKFNVKWSLGSRVNLINEDIARLMKLSGCDTIYFGIENGDQKILNKIKKGITIEEVRKGVDIANKYGLKPHGSFILGLPFDNKESIEKTIQFALSLPLEVATFHLATPYPNTEFEKIALDYGIIHSMNWAQYRGHPDEVIYTPHGLTKEYLLAKQKEAYRRFYLRPRIFYIRAKSLFSPKFPKILAGYLKGLKALLKS